MDISNEIIEMLDGLIESKFSEKMAKLSQSPQPKGWGLHSDEQEQLID